MVNRNRGVPIQVYLTQEEKTQIESNMEKAGYSNFSAYAREMLLHGEIYHVELVGMKELLSEFGNLNRNFHQIVYRAALINDIKQEDYNDILNIWDQAWKLIRRRLKYIIHTDGKIILTTRKKNENEGEYPLMPKKQGEELDQEYESLRKFLRP